MPPPSMPMPMRTGPQHGDVVVVDLEQIEEDPDREGDEDVGRQPALRGQRPDVALQALPLAQRPGRRPQRLGEVAADLALDADRHRRPAHVRAVHPVRHPLERVADVGADPRLGQGPRELLRQRLGGVLGDGVERLAERESGRQAAGQQHEDIGQLGLELLGPSAREVPEDDGREHEAENGADEEEDKSQHEAVAEEDEQRRRTDEDGDQAEHPPLPGTDRQVGALDEPHRLRRRVAPLHETVPDADQALGERRRGWLLGDCRRRCWATGAPHR